MLKNPRLEYVLRELKRRRGKFKSISKGSRVTYKTIKNISRGAVKDPRGSNLDALYSYFQRGA